MLRTSLDSRSSAYGEHGPGHHRGGEGRAGMSQPRDHLRPGAAPRLAPVLVSNSAIEFFPKNISCGIGERLGVLLARPSRCVFGMADDVVDEPRPRGLGDCHHLSLEVRELAGQALARIGELLLERRQSRDEPIEAIQHERQLADRLRD